MKDFRYILRYYIDPGYCEDERIAELVDFCKNSSIGEVMLFFNPEEVNNGHITIDELANFIPMAKKIKSVLAENGIELIILAGFMSILSEDFTSAYPKRILNVHPSLIPSFCGKGFYGLHVHEAALAYGVKVTGATVHFVNEIPDGGEIILQRAVEIKEGDTPEILQKRVMEEAEWHLLPAAAEVVSARIRQMGDSYGK